MADEYAEDLAFYICPKGHKVAAPLPDDFYERLNRALATEGLEWESIRPRNSPHRQFLPVFFSVELAVRDGYEKPYKPRHAKPRLEPVNHFDAVLEPSS